MEGCAGDGDEAGALLGGVDESVHPSDTSSAIFVLFVVWEVAEGAFCFIDPEEGEGGCLLGEGDFRSFEGIEETGDGGDGCGAGDLFEAFEGDISALEEMCSVGVEEGGLGEDLVLDKQGCLFSAHGVEESWQPFCEEIAGGLIGFSDAFGEGGAGESGFFVGSFWSAGCEEFCVILDEGEELRDGDLWIVGIVFCGEEGFCVFGFAEG